MTTKRRRSRAFVQAFSEAMRLVALDYASFVSRLQTRDTEEDSKLFGARHAAARSCLSHLEQLLDLIGEDVGLEHVREGFALLHEAQAALALPAHPDGDADADADPDAD